MSLTEELDALFDLKSFRGKFQIFSGNILQVISESMATTGCVVETQDDCRDESEAWVLKMIAIATILTAGVTGVAIPLVGKKRRLLRTDGNLFIATKAFAAGVILATGFVHMLPDGSSALSDPCLPEKPWSKFPFSGFIAMMASLLTLLFDFVGTQFYERRHEGKATAGNEPGGDKSVETASNSVIVPVECGAEKVFGVGIHAHAAHHSHSHSHRHTHPHGHQASDGNAVGLGIGHSHGFEDSEEEEEAGGVRHVVVSQILELGIVSHSVIIGLSLGVSQSPCSIRPLIAALSFHQFFEGLALGGCISQARLKWVSATVMASFYNPNSPRALAIEGILDSVSAGILVYMALVDLIAADFMSKRMRCNARLQAVSLLALFLGAGLMSSLAIWA
uniref:Zinc transporter 4, chloroplastic-like n=1 Tax=Nelumbo nucifera TaxID=4432 RepID=A0A822ZWY1_NELNU|nr:TPA_asm: hypothetical protein HUJ06_018927 [Nelumbo nucifera]